MRMQPNTHDENTRYCKIYFESDDDRNKALYKLIHEQRANFSGTDNKEYIVSRKICDELSKSIKINHRN